MFAVLYSFKVLPGKNADFITGWSGLTKLIYQYEKSLGSRLHQSDTHTYIAYAQWPDRSTWENAGNNLPHSAAEFRKLMKESCVSITTDVEMDMIEDLLQIKQY